MKPSINKRSKMSFNILFICAWSFLVPSGAFAEVVDKIAIIVNDEIITEGEIDVMLDPVFQKYKELYKGEELEEKMSEALENAQKQLIEDRLIVSEAKRLNIDVDEKAVEARIREMRERLGGKENFTRALANQHLTLKELKTRYREQMMSRRLIDSKIGSKILITPVEVADYYNKNSGQFIRPEEVRFYHILIPLKDANPKEALNLAKEISGRLREGGEFAALAKVYSQGPDASVGGLSGFIKRGDLMPEIENVVFNMKPGEVSDIVQTSLGYHIFKLEEKRPREILPFAEVEQDIEEALFREKARQKLKDWIEKLKSNAYIAYK